MAVRVQGQALGVEVDGFLVTAQVRGSSTNPDQRLFTLGMHAGYAVYFPELYPTRLRGTGAGFCFNMGRLATAAAFFGFGAFPVPAETKAVYLAPLYLVGVVIVFFARETRNEELPE